jgi:TolB protein
MSKLADGRFEIRYRLWDAVKSQELGGQSFVALPDDLRLVAHRIADQIYEKLTGDKGIFSTRITYVTKQGNRHMLWVADPDGENAQAALTSPEPIISPNWAPNGNELAYVSFESRKPVVYVHDVSSGKRRVLANFKGSNSAPAWAPDGKSLAISLSKDGGTQLFILDAKGGEPKHISQSPSIDTEPAYSPDGTSIYFVSDRGGSPQIYRVPVNGGSAQRVTFTGNYNVSPALSPDGRWLSYISRGANGYKIHLMDLASVKVTALTESSYDEKPTFAPNSKLIMYATKVQSREVLMTTTLDGKIGTRLAGQAANIREPHWGPFLKP